MSTKVSNVRKVNVKAAKKEVQVAKKAVQRASKDLAGKTSRTLSRPKPKATKVYRTTSITPKSHSKNNEAVFRSKKKGQKSAYLQSLLNPWLKLDAKIPDMHPYPSAAFQIQYEKLVATTPDGLCGVLLRADLTRNWGALSFPGAEMELLSWESVPENESIINAFSSFRIVSMGLRLKYQAPPLEAEGRLACALIPPFAPCPGFGAQTYSWDDISKLEGAQVIPAIDGATVLFRPFDNHAFQYRETQLVKALANGDLEKSGYSNSIGDPIVTLMMLQRAWHEATVVAGPLISDLVQLFPFDGVGESVQEMADAMCTLGCPYLVVMGDGMPASINAFSCEVVMNLEAISDNRTWSLTQSKTNLSHPNELPTALAVRSHVPDVHAGGSPESHNDFLKSTTGAVKAATETVTAGAEIVDVLGSLVSAFGLL
jgi:hypothetical protein